MDKSLRPTIDTKDISDLLKATEAAVLTKELLDDSFVAGLAKAIENGSRLKELTVEAVRRDLSEQCIKDLTRIMARSELRKFSVYLKEDDGCLHILEPIQWEHLRELRVTLSRPSIAMSVMKALADGAKKVSGKVVLEEFWLTACPLDSLPRIEDEILSLLTASSTSFKKLRLDVVVPYEWILALFKVIAHSQLQSLYLRTKDLDSAEIDTLLDVLQDAPGLRRLMLRGASITDKQIERMRTKGITWDRT
jgi:hypothetical protein